MFLDRNLLVEKEEGWALPPELYSCWNARGLYNPTQFVLRLRPDIQKELESIEPGIKSSGELQFQQIQAFSTYFHETIHWWQHVGSTLGLVLSLIYPAQAHINNKDLIKLIQDIGPVKSISKYNIIYNIPLNNETDSRINRVLNNWHDIEFFRWLVIDPKKADNIIKSPYFESIGHSYSIAYGSILWLLSSTIDRDLGFLPDVRTWEKEFILLNKNKVKGYYYGSEIVLPPLGAREIFEGQARFSQLQYLYFSSGGKMHWEDFERAGMLSGLYREAFDTFLKIIDSSWPGTPEDPLVGLFLLICDIAINPTDGFPFDLYHFPSFVLSVDPGIRFLMLCQSIQRKYPQLVDSIHGYTKEEYLEVCEILCKDISCKTPFSAAEKICDWANTYANCKGLLKEDNSFEFAPENLPVRLLFARFLRFQQDKFNVPEYFCWPGAWSAGDRKGGITLEKVEDLFDEHRALFCDGIDGDIYPRTFQNKDEESVQKTFNAFYSWNATYDLTRQWIVQDGDFEYNFSWLTSKYLQSEVVAWACNYFKDVYGVDPMSFKIL